MEETAIALQAAYAQKIEELPINDWRFMAAARHIAKQLRTLPIGRLRWPGDMFPVQVAPSAVHGRGVFVTPGERVFLQFLPRSWKAEGPK